MFADVHQENSNKTVVVSLWQPLFSIYLAARVDERLRKINGSHFVLQKSLHDELLNNNAARDDDPC